MDILKYQKPTVARKQHKCYWCRGPILVGEKYHYSVQVDDDLWAFKTHTSCDELIDKLNMRDGCDWDEGLSDGDFHDYVNHQCMHDFPEEYDDLEWREQLAMLKTKYLGIPKEVVEELKVLEDSKVPTILADFFYYWWNVPEGTNTTEASKKWWEENKMKYIGAANELERKI